MTDSLNSADRTALSIAYLNILQTIIARMSNYVLAIQTASLTTLTALLAFSASDNVCMNAFVFIIPCVFFAGFHFYFLRLEKTFRNLYNEATTNNDISLSTFKIDYEDLKRLRPQSSKVLNSPSLYVFYPFLLSVVLIAYSFLER